MDSTIGGNACRQGTFKLNFNRTVQAALVALVILDPIRYTADVTNGCT